jgi:uncharacterized membrane protein YjjB (DUF3815 family)
MRIDMNLVLGNWVCCMVFGLLGWLIYMVYQNDFVLAVIMTVVASISLVLIIVYQIVEYPRYT